VNVFVPCWTSEHYSKAIEGDKSVPVVLRAQMEESVVTIQTERLKICVGDDFAIDFYRADGTPLMQTHRDGREFESKVSEQIRQILEAEGHDTSNLGARDYKVQMVADIDPEDDFYGLGDKTGFLNKKYYEYENWNSDIPQAHNEDYRALYKSIPFLMCKKKNSVYGIFFDNTFHSYLNLGKENPQYFYYGADDGNLDYYFLGGDNMVELVEEYTYLTGRTPLPQRWTLGYQQSRWGCECSEDIREVAGQYRSLDIPCDVIHFDIDYMDGYRVFTWNDKDYGKPGELFEELREQGYKAVTIIDPGTKLDEDYFMCQEGTQNHYFATDTDGKIYVNEVWPGESNYPDFGREEVRNWWGEHHKFLLDIGAAGIWNDMNEPASFQGELPMDVVFHDEERTTNHAEMHNVYGHYMSKATFDGLRKLSNKRPFVITRACYAGTQKYSTVWTGDNQSLWSHLQMMVPQMCNLGMSGFAFAGTDVGGFGADTTPELLARWVEAASFSPLFRNHSAKGSKRQEPWLYGEQVVDIHRKYIKLRYQFLPYLYDLFYQGEKTGLPVMRPLVLHYENDPNTHNLNGEFLVGESLLVAPVLEQGATHKMVYLPEGNWYDYWTGEKQSGGQYILRDAPLDVCPIYVKEGSLIPMYEEMSYVGEKPYNTLYLLSTPGAAACEHFQDNGEDYAYREGVYNLYAFSKSEDGTLSADMLHESYPKYENIVLKEVGK
jgi:alpha-glucosidase